MRPGRRRREPTRLPARFRWRLTAAFVLVAAVAAGVVAVLGILIANEYRWRAYRDRADDEAGLVLALAPEQLDAERFERLRAQYELRSDADVVAQGPAGSYSSSAALSPDDVPGDLRDVTGAEPRNADAVVAGRHYLVVGAQAEGGDRYWLFFSVEELRASLGELTRASAVAFVLTVAIAGLVGRYLAVRTLRPVGAAAAAAEEVRAGRRGARLPEGPDEFGGLAASFNRMADTVQETIAQLERSAERERRFTADVAHELRTPLTGLAASAGLLADTLPTLPPDARRPAALLVEEVRRLRTLVLELLELSRLDAAADTPRPEPLGLGAAIDAAVRGLGPAAPGSLSVAIEPGLRVAAEPGRLERILGNLLANAAQHGGGRVEVTGRRRAGAAVVEVVDHGPGIPAGDLPRVFDRFAKSDRSRASGGSGLGLAIARAHAQAQGGDLTADNAEGAGARFTLRLPAAPEASGDAPLGPAPADAPVSRG